MIRLEKDCEDGLMLNKVVDIYCSNELVKKQIEVIKGQNTKYHE